MINYQEEIDLTVESPAGPVAKATLQYLEEEVRKGNKIKPSLRRQQELSIMYVQIAKIKIVLKQHQAAVEAYGKAIGFNQKNFEAFYGRANLRKEEKNFHKAKEDYQRCIALEPGRKELFFYLGMCHYYDHDYDTALHFFDQFVKFNPQEALSYFYRGHIHEKLKNYTRAVSDYEEAIRLKHPVLSIVYCFLAQAKQRLSRFTEALLDYDKAIELEPQNDELFLNRATCKMLLKQYQDAMLDYQKTSELNPENLNSILGIGLCYHSLEAYEKAIACFDQLRTRENFDKNALKKYRLASEIALKKKESEIQKNEPPQSILKILSVLPQSILEKRKEKKALERKKRQLKKMKEEALKNKISEKVLKKTIQKQKKQNLAQKRENFEQGQKISELTELLSETLIAKTQEIDTLQKENEQKMIRLQQEHEGKIASIQKEFEVQTKSQAVTIKTLTAEIEKLNINRTEKKSEPTHSNHPSQVYSQGPQWAPQFQSYQQAHYQQPYTPLHMYFSPQPQANAYVSQQQYHLPYYHAPYHVPNFF